MHITTLLTVAACGIISQTNVIRAEELKSTIDTIEEFAKLDHPFYYSIHYSKPGCNTSAVSFHGFVTGTLSTIQFPSWAIDPLITDQTLCAANAECSVLDMLTPDKCPVQIPIVSNIIDDDTVVMAYNSANGTEETKEMDNEYCQFSGLFHGCKYTYQTLDKIKSNPAMFENNNKDDLEIMKNYIYYAFYEDDKCEDLASIFTSVSGETVDVPIVSENDYSCAVGSVCALNEDSDLCKAMKSDDVATFTSITSVDEETGEVDVYGCDTSNAAIDQDECSVIKPTECVKSSLVAGCHLRIFSGVEIANNPRALLFGEVGDTSASVNGESDVVNDPEDGEGDPQDDMNADEKEEIKIEEGYDTQDASGVSIISWDMFTGLLLVFTLLLV